MPRIMVQRLGEQFQSENFCIRKHALQHLVEIVFYLFLPKRLEILLYFSALQIISLHQEQDYLLLRRKDAFIMQISMQDDHLCNHPSLNEWQKNAHLYWTSKYISRNRQQLVWVLFKDDSSFTHSGERFRAFVDLEKIRHQLQRIQYSW